MMIIAYNKDKFVRNLGDSCRDRVALCTAVDLDDCAVCATSMMTVWNLVFLWVSLNWTKRSYSLYNKHMIIFINVEGHYENDCCSRIAISWVASKKFVSRVINIPFLRRGVSCSLSGIVRALLRSAKRGICETLPRFKNSRHRSSQSPLKFRSNGVKLLILHIRESIRAHILQKAIQGS